MTKEHLHRPVTVTISELQKQDIKQLEPILRQCIVDSETGKVEETEVQDVLRYMQGEYQEEERHRNYYVAKDQEGNVLGCMAFTTPDQDMLELFNTTTEESAELVNAFIAPSARGLGVGRHLFNAVSNGAQASGCSQLIVNSGPRYQKSWGFYDRVCDSRHELLKDYYGQDYHAQTWITYLV